MTQKSIWLMLIVFLLPGVLMAQQNALQEEEDFQFAQQLETKEMYDLAASQFQSFAETYPTSPRASEALLRAGENMTKAGDTAAAATLYQRLMMRYPETRILDQAQYNRAALLADMGEFQEAALTFDRIRFFDEQSSLIPDAQLNAGEAYLQAGSHQSALDAVHVFTEQFSRHPGRLRARYLLARIHLAMGRPDIALKQLDRLSAERLDDALLEKALLLRAHVLRNIGRYGAADSALSRVVFSPTPSDSLGQASVMLVESYRRSGEYERADTVADQALSATTLDPRFRYQLLQDRGDLAYLRGSYTQAVEWYDKAAQLPLSKDDYTLWFRIGRAHARLGHSKQALSNFKAVLASPDTVVEYPRVRVEAAKEASNALVDRDEPLEALHLLRTEISVLGQESAAAELLLYIGAVQEKSLQDYTGARRSYSTLLDLYSQTPQVDEAHLGIARCHELEMNYDLARRTYKRFLTLYPASEFIDTARKRSRYLSLFTPSRSVDVSEAVDLILGGNLSTRPQAVQLTQLAEEQIHTFHHYRSALRTLRRALQTEGRESMNRPRVLYLLGLAHTRLAEKNYSLDKLSKARAHQDTLQRTTELMRNNFPNSDWTQKTISDFYTVRVMLDPARNASILAEALKQGNLTRKTENEFTYKLAYHYYDSATVPIEKSLPLVKDVIQHTDSDTLLAQAFALQAYLFAKEGQKDTARVLLKHVIDTFPSLPAAPQALYTYADWSESAGDTVAAMDTFETMAEKYFYARVGHDALTRLIDLMVRTGKNDQARKILSQKLDRLPESLIDFIPHTIEDKLGWLWVRVQLESQNPAASLATLRHYILSHPKSQHRAEAYYRIGNVALDMGKLDAALGHFQELAEHYPESELAQKGRLQSARLYFDREEYQTARDIYNRQIPNLMGSFQRTAKEYRIRCEYRLGNLSRGDQLLQSFRSRYDNRSSEARILYERGQVLLKEKRFHEAEKTFERLTDDYDDLPEGGRGELGLARMYVILNKTDEALKTLTRITTEYDDPILLAAAYVNLGDFYYENRQLQNCIVACKRVLNHQQQGREHRLALNLLINAYDDVRLWDQAIAQARMYVQTYPNAEDVMAKRVKIGVFLYYLKEYDRAIDYLTQLKRRVDAETETEIQYWIAKAYADRGHLDTAIAEFLKVRYVCKQTKWPWGVTALYEAGNAYQKLGKYNQARRLYKEIVRERGKSDQFGQVALKKLEEIELKINSSSPEAEHETQSRVQS